jgi:predicted CXXCH cytochrome family protein
VLGLAFAAVLAGCAIGCTTRKRYQVLSFFFDGVPDPDAPRGAASAARRNTRTNHPVFVHKPFSEEKCSACHLNSQDIFTRAKIRPDACLDCHPNVPREHASVHGPVVNNLCLWCHSPHSSPQEHLLKAPAPKLCTQCHDPATLGPTPPEHLDRKADCLSCHSGHGGQTGSFLKALAAAPPPPALPATAPSLESGAPR